jgi:hypothetical protein
MTGSCPSGKCSSINRRCSRLAVVTFDDGEAQPVDDVEQVGAHAAAQPFARLGHQLSRAGLGARSHSSSL